MSTSRGTEPSELVAVVDDLLNSLTSKFNNISSEMLGKCE
jgi:heat shock factor-binding protein 1